MVELSAQVTDVATESLLLSQQKIGVEIVVYIFKTAPRNRKQSVLLLCHTITYDHSYVTTTSDDM